MRVSKHQKTNIAHGTKSICAVDLFCGAGGLTRGLLNAGVNVRLGVDIDPVCEYPFTENNRVSFLHKSVADIDAEEIASCFVPSAVSLLAGCAPCQTFSTYNQKATKQDKRWWLLSAVSPM